MSQELAKNFKHQDCKQYSIGRECPQVNNGKIDIEFNYKGILTLLSIVCIIVGVFIGYYNHQERCRDRIDSKLQKMEAKYDKQIKELKDTFSSRIISLENETNLALSKIETNINNKLNKFRQTINDNGKSFNDRIDEARTSINSKINKSKIQIEVNKNSIKYLNGFKSNIDKDIRQCRADVTNDIENLRYEVNDMKIYFSSREVEKKAKFESKIRIPSIATNRQSENELKAVKFKADTDKGHLDVEETNSNCKKADINLECDPGIDVAG